MLRFDVLVYVQAIELSSCSFFCADAASRGPGWRPDLAADVPGAHLLREGYSLIAAEPKLTLSISPPGAEDGIPIAHSKCLFPAHTLMLPSILLAARDRGQICSVDFAEACNSLYPVMPSYDRNCRHI